MIFRTFPVTEFHTMFGGHRVPPHVGDLALAIASDGKMVVCLIEGRRAHEFAIVYMRSAQSDPIFALRVPGALRVAKYVGNLQRWNLGEVSIRDVVILGKER